VQRVARTLTVAAALAYLASLIPGVRHGTGVSTLWDVGVYAGVPLLAAVTCTARAVAVQRDRVAWALFAVGLTSYSAGTVVFNAVLLPGGNPPYPSIADALWLVLYPACILAIWLMVRARMAGFGASMWLDGLVSGLGLGSLSAMLVFTKVTQTDGSTAAVLTNFAYPILDLALLITAVAAITTLGAWRDRGWLLISGGFLTFSVADSWYLLQVADNSYHAGSLVDFTYLAAAAMIAIASTPRGDGVPEATVEASSRSFFVPGAFALLAMAVLAAQVREPAMTVAVGLALGALTASWVRTALTVREVVALADSRRQARTDALTGLPNRRAFSEVLQSWLEEPGDGRSRLGCLIIADLDRFKEINDAVGHQIGDELLRELSHRFAQRVPTGGTIARLDGDELAVFVPEMIVDEAVELSRQLLSARDEPFLTQKLALHLTASIGITSVEPGIQVSQALAKADLAMYRAKATHIGWRVYDQHEPDAWDRLALGEDLREALATGTGLIAEFQPICVLPDLEPVGLEALVRWIHPVRGRIAPDDFLPMAEKAGLMGAITGAVLDLSLDEARRLRDRGCPLSVSVNLSASDLMDDRLVEHVEQALADRGLPGEALRIEITESLLVDTGTGAIDRLLRLRALGVDLAVDDYGTGYSCLAYLHDLPVSHLKIDRGFVGRVLTDDRTAVIVASTIEMAHGLGLKVVAEGLETVEQQDWLLTHGCDLVQGYLLSKPLPADRLYPWLSAHARPVSRTIPV
jgi:diguanylate cyclase